MSEVKTYSLYELQGYTSVYGKTDFVAKDDYAALQQRLDVAIKRGDACMQAEMVWEKAMMAAIGEDGVGCVVKAIAALKAERDALAAAHSQLRESMAAIHNTIKLDGVSTSLGALLSASKRAHENSVPTAAALNVIRAEGITMFASTVLAAAGDLESTITIERLMLDAEEFAGQLRGSKDGE